MYIVREEPLGYTKENLIDVVPLVTPYAIMIDPSGACNFKCCFCPCNNADEKGSERHKIMSFDLFKKIIDGVAQFEKKVPIIDLYGLGEPLLNKDFVKMVKYLKEKDCCDMIRTTTNGSLLNRRLIDELVDSGIDYIKISIEGLAASDYKQLCDVDVDFDEIVANIAYLYEKSRGKLEIGTKIIASVFKSLEDRQRYLDLFSPITDYTYIRNVQTNWAEFDGMVVPEGTEDGKYCNNKIPPYDICSYPLTHMIVHSNGDIGLCCYDWKHETSYTNATVTTIPEAWNSKELKKIRLLHLTGRRSELPYCSSCIRKGYDNIDAVALDIAEIIKGDNQ